MCRISEPSELPTVGVIQAEEAVVGAKASCTCTDIRSSSVIVRKRRGQACQVPNNAAPYPPSQCNNPHAVIPPPQCNNTRTLRTPHSQCNSPHTTLRIPPSQRNNPHALIPPP